MMNNDDNDIYQKNCRHHLYLKLFTQKVQSIHIVSIIGVLTLL